MITRLREGSIARHVLMLGAGTAIGQAVVLLASPLWSRLYEPADFGRLGLMLSFLSTASVAVSLRYDLAIPLARDRDESIRLLLLCLLLAGPTAAICGVIFGALCVTGILGFDAVPPWSAVLVAALLAVSGPFTALRFWYVRISGFASISRSLIGQGIARAIVPILLAPLNIGWLGLAAGEAAGRLVGVRKLALPVVSALALAARTTTRPELLQVMRRFRQYPGIFLPSSILDALAAAIALPIFVRLFGIEVGGQFLLAQQIVLVPAALLSASLSDVYHARFVESAKERPHDLPAIVARGAGRLMLLCAAIYVPIMIAAPFVTVPVFGERWQQAGQFVVWLAPAAAVAAAVSPLTRALVLSRIPQVKFVADTVKIVLPVIGLYFGTGGGTMQPMDSLIGFSIMSIASYALYLGVVLYAVQARHQLKP